ncbi:phosphoribosyltransferase family protein [Magnetovibrio sp. PR-2]|uniref:phosphoribosyltransferase n=1 Tax=Magnetovibrio sp. PR-2 TaxID=3120356 RepID=UPI002FCE3727
MTEKYFISANELLEDSFKLGHQIFDDGFRPDYIVGIWRGGTPVGIAVQELLEYRGAPSDHISIRTSSYTGIEQQSDDIRVHGLHYIIENANAEDSMLIIDDVFDSGRSIDAVIKTIHKLSRANTPSVIKTATVYYKPTKRKVDITPDYYVHETDKWLVFPHELDGLTDAEIMANKPAAKG